MIEFSLLIISFIFLSFFVFRQKLHLYPSIFLYWGMIIIFITPSTYIFFGGESYNMYSVVSATNYYILATLSIWLTFIFYIIRSLSVYNVKIKTPIDVSLNITNTNKIWTFFVFFTLAYSVGYFLFYFDRWPLFQMLAGDFEVRPDIDNEGFKFYFFTSVVYNVIMPLIFFNAYQRVKKNRLKLILLFSTVVFFLIIGGNKGVLFYFLIFCMFFLFKRKGFLIIVFFAILALVVYAIAKGVSVNYETLSTYLLESIFRRIFVTQGISIPNAFEMYHNGFNFSALSSNEIKYAVFEYVYRVSPGSMPLFYTAELYLRYGIAASVILSFVITVLLAFFCCLVERYKSILFYWCSFYVMFVFVMSGVSEANIFRFIFVSFIVFFLWFINNVKVRR